MGYTVYADMLFLVNWLMDCALLKAVSIVLQQKARKRRIAAAAAVGALWVCLITVCRLPKGLENLGSLTVASTLMVVIAFGFCSIKMMLKELVTLYGIAILGGGLVNQLYFHTTVGVFLKSLVWGDTSGEAKSAVAVLFSGAAVGCAVWFIRKISVHRYGQSRIYEVKLFLGEDSVTLRGLLDTGNRLREPVTKKAVHIGVKEALAPLKPDLSDRVRLLVPYHAVGTEQGLLPVLRIDKMELTAADGTCISVDKPLIGLYSGCLSSEDEYQMILHTEIETRQGETL